MPNIRTDTPLAIAVTEAIQTGDIQTLKRLLTENPGLATSRLEDDDPRGIARTLLHVATDWPGHFPNGIATVVTLVEAGADVNARFVGPHAETPLHWAASNNDVEVLDALLDRGARTTLWDVATLGLMDRLEGYFAGEAPPAEDIHKAFWGACHGGQRRSAEYLLACGAEGEWIPPWERKTALDAARRSKAGEVVEWLLGLGARSACDPS